MNEIEIRNLTKSYGEQTVLKDGTAPAKRC